MYINEMKLFFEALMLTANLPKEKSCKLLRNRREMAVALNMPWLSNGTTKGLEYKMILDICVIRTNYMARLLA